MVLEVRADARQVDPALDADLGEVVARADAREHQQLRAVDRAAAEQHLAGGADGVLGAALAEGEPGRPLPLELDPARQRPGGDGQVGPVPGGLEVGLVGRPAAAALAGDLVEPGALLLGAVEVVGRLEPGADRALDERVAEVVGVAAVLDVQRAALAVERAAEAGVVLGLA